MKKILLLGLLAVGFGAVGSARAGVAVSVGLPGISMRVGVPVPVYVAPPIVYARPAPVYVSPPSVYIPPPPVVYRAPVCPPPVVYVPRHRHHHPRLHVALPLPPLPPFCR